LEDEDIVIFLLELKRDLFEVWTALINFLMTALKRTCDDLELFYMCQDV